MEEKVDRIKKSRKRFLVWAIPVLIVVALGVMLILPSLLVHQKWPYEHSWGDAISFPIMLKGCAEAFKKREYANLGDCYLVGNDLTIKNNGKFCGLYYEVTNGGERVCFIGKNQAAADYRSSEDPDSLTGTYTPSILKDGRVEYLPEVIFKREHRNWWYALMKYYDDGKKKIPYDKAYSRDHFAICVFPAVKGEGLATFIMNENGIVYEKVFDDPKYIDTYPGPSPEDHGWGDVRK